jgi:hypothetical protein
LISLSLHRFLSLFISIVGTIGPGSVGRNEVALNQNAIARKRAAWSTACEFLHPRKLLMVMGKIGNPVRMSPDSNQMQLSASGRGITDHFFCSPVMNTFGIAIT